MAQFSYKSTFDTDNNNNTTPLQYTVLFNHEDVFDMPN